MAEAQTPAAKSTIIDALVLACSHSGIREVVGTDALRSVLEVEYRELMAEGSFDLQQLWELFQDQPGFDPEAAAAPLCRFKTWERQLGISVTLPESLRQLDAGEVQQRAADCKVPRPELQKLLRGPAPPAGAAASRKPARGEAKKGAKAASGGKKRPRRSSRARITQLVAGLVILVTFGFAGLTTYRSCDTSPKYKSIAASEFAGSLPITEAKRIGAQMEATLTDPNWLQESRETREKQLGDSLRKLESKGITVLYLRDRGGKVRAVAQFYDNRNKLRFEFR